MELLSRQKSLTCGDVTPIESVPYAVSVHAQSLFDPKTNDSNIPRAYVCCGTILSPYHILTVADHIFPNLNLTYVVRVGSSVSNKEGSVHLVKSYTKHRGHRAVRDEIVVRGGNSTNLTWHHVIKYDLVILKLEEPIELDNKTKQAISLIEADKIVEPETYATAYGWGCIYKPDGLINLDFVLHRMRMKMINSENCKEIFKNPVTTIPTLMYNIPLIKGKMCANFDNIYNDNDTRRECNTGINRLCTGIQDDGGPLVLNGKLIGIMNWSSFLHYNPELWPVRFIDVAYYRNWIEDQLAL